MPKWDRWRKALAISVLVHCLLLAGAGWLGGSLLKAARVPEFIEVELIGDPGQSEQKAAATAAPAVPVRRSVSETVAAERHEAVATVADEAVAEGSAPSAQGASGSSGAAMAGPALPAAAGVADAPKRIAAPRLLFKTEPEYPEEARRAGAEGTVTVRIEIKENGQPGEVAISRSSGRASFDAAAVEAIRSWRFVPAQEEASGRAVRCYTTVSVVFRLRN